MNSTMLSLLYPLRPTVLLLLLGGSMLPSMVAAQSAVIPENQLLVFHVVKTGSSAEYRLDPVAKARNPVIFSTVTERLFLVLHRQVNFPLVESPQYRYQWVPYYTERDAWGKAKKLYDLSEPSKLYRVMRGGYTDLMPDLDERIFSLPLNPAVNETASLQQLTDGSNLLWGFSEIDVVTPQKNFLSSLHGGGVWGNYDTINVTPKVTLQRLPSSLYGHWQDSISQKSADVLEPDSAYFSRASGSQKATIDIALTREANIGANSTGKTTLNDALVAVRKKLESLGYDLKP